MTALLLIFMSALATGARAQWPAGKVIEQQTVRSTILEKNVRYTIYLPADYGTSERSYPVVYLLHGYTDDNTGWLQFGEINRLADKAIAEGNIPPMIIVMPNGDSSWYINSYDGKEKYEDFFVNEFIPSIEKTYRIKADRRYRGIAGLSMGGYGTMIYLLKHPDLFSAGAALSAAVFDDSSVARMPNPTYDLILGQLVGRGLRGEARVNAALKANSPLDIIAEKPAGELKKVRYWIDCGDDDGLSKGNCEMHIALMEKGVPHEFRVRDGAHTWTYWRSGIIDGLQFIGQSFHQQ